MAREWKNVSGSLIWSKNGWCGIFNLVVINKLHGFVFLFSRVAPNKW